MNHSTRFDIKAHIKNEDLHKDNISFLNGYLTLKLTIHDGIVE
jgi:hypothetical protein